MGLVAGYLCHLPLTSNTEFVDTRGVFDNVIKNFIEIIEILKDTHSTTF